MRDRTALGRITWYLRRQEYRFIARRIAGQYARGQGKTARTADGVLETGGE